MILTNPNSGELYTIEDDTITNLTQGRNKPFTEDDKGAFTFPTRLNHAAQQNPLIIELIETLGLALEY